MILQVIWVICGNTKRITSNQKRGDLSNLSTVSNSDMELANDFNENFTNIGTSSTLSSTSSRVYDQTDMVVTSLLLLRSLLIK